MRITIDLDACIMAGECVYNHPEVFAWDEGGQPVVVRSSVAGPAERLVADQAIAVCPGGAIALAADSG